MTMYHKDPNVNSFCVGVVTTLNGVLPCLRAFTAIGQALREKPCDQEHYGRAVRQLREPLVNLESSIQLLLPSAEKISPELRKTLEKIWL